MAASQGVLLIMFGVLALWVVWSKRSPTGGIGNTRPQGNVPSMKRVPGMVPPAITPITPAQPNAADSSTIPSNDTSTPPEQGNPSELPPDQPSSQPPDTVQPMDPDYYDTPSQVSA